MITVSTLTTSLAEANSAELRRQAARRRAVAGMQYELDSLERPRPRRTRLRLMLAAAAAIGVALLAASSAWADSTHFYAAPGGSFAGSCTNPVAPCDAQYAVDSVPAGGDVELAPGTYKLNSPLNVPKPLTLHGPAGGPRPTILNDHTTCATCPNVALAISSQSVTVRDVHVVEAGATNGAAIYAASLESSHPDTLERVIAEGDDGAAIWIVGATVVRDSVAWSPNIGGSGIYVEGIGENTSVDLYNVTAVAGVSGVGLNVSDSCAPGCTVATRAENSIFEGGSDDVSSNGHGAGSHPVVTLVHSNYRLRSPDDWIGFPTTDGNQSGTPQFVDATTGDFREQPGSPTVNAGAASPLIGAADLAGAARLSGSAPDIGAFELQEAAPVHDPAPSSGSQPPASQPARTAPAPAHARARFRGVRIRRRSLTVKHGKVTLLVSCPAGQTGACSGRLTITKAGAHSSRRGTLGRARFRLAAGKSRHVRVKLSRAALRHKRFRAVATVVAHDAHGDSFTTTARLRLRVR